MQLYHNLAEQRSSAPPIVLTIGNFDGVHLGHQAILEGLKKNAKDNQALASVLTFSNHPSSILDPNKSVPLLCTNEHKIHLLEQSDIDSLFLIPFTKEFSQQSAEVFLQYLKERLPIKGLILGSDATIGKNREGGQSTVRTLAKQLGFDIHYLSDCLVNGERISSSKIRELIRQGEFKLAEKFLGRPYSIYSRVVQGTNRGKAIGFPTANIAVETLTLPPLGVYAVTLLYQGKRLAGVANLGIAPTIGVKNSPVLEVHLFDQNPQLYGELVEVFFLAYLRPENRFNSIAELQKQIENDILTVKKIINII